MTKPTSWSFVDRLDMNEQWRPDIVPGGFKYTALSDKATMTIVRFDPKPDVDVAKHCGGTIPVGTCVTQSGSVALVQKP